MRGFHVWRGYLIVLLLWLFPVIVQGAPGEGLDKSARDKGWVLDQEEISRMLESHLQKIVNEPKKRIEIKELRGCDAVLLPPGRLSHEVIVPEQAYRGGALSATLRFLIDGKEKERIRVSARVEIYADVVAAAHFLQKHHEIRERDVLWVNRNVAVLPNDIVLEMGEVLNHRTTLSINGQEVLRKGMVEVPPLVKRGDRVIMSVENHRFRITAWGEVKEEGRKGDRIKLVNLSSRKEVFGRVLNGGTVQIDY